MYTELYGKSNEVELYYFRMPFMPTRFDFRGNSEKDAFDFMNTSSNICSTNTALDSRSKLSVKASHIQKTIWLVVKRKDNNKFNVLFSYSPCNRFAVQKSNATYFIKPESYWNYDGNFKIMKRYHIKFMGSVSLYEEDLVEKRPEFNSLSEEEKKDIVLNCLYEGVGSHPDITSFELFDGSVDIVDDEDLKREWDEFLIEVNDFLDRTK